MSTQKKKALPMPFIKWEEIDVVEDIHGHTVNIAKLPISGGIALHIDCSKQDDNGVLYVMDSDLLLLESQDGVSMSVLRTVTESHGLFKCALVDRRQKDLIKNSEDEEDFGPDSVCIPESTAVTSLNTKEHEPLIIRKYTQYGFPLYIALICGANLNDLDDHILKFMDKHQAIRQSALIQDKRNLAGMLTEHLRTIYGHKTEGVAVVWYVDKMMVNSMFGDFMNHTACRIELFSLLNMMTNV